MGRLWLSGDAHGEILDKFSYAQHPRLKKENGGFQEGDVAVILGDTGLMWPNLEATTEYELTQIAKTKPGLSIIFMFGNHDNYTWAKTLPEVDAFGGKAKRVVVNGKVYDNLYVVDRPTMMEVCGHSCLLIPGAQSHDIDALTIPGEDKLGLPYLRREIDQTWWPEEEIDIRATLDVLDTLDGPAHFDLILTHDCPGYFTTIASPHGGAEWRMNPTVGERFLQTLYRNLDFGHWFHGHMHYEFFPYTDPVRKDLVGARCCCIYHEIQTVEDWIYEMDHYRH